MDIPFKEASQRILTPSNEAADLPIAPPNRSDTACHNIKLMGKQGHVEENKIGSCLRISNLSKLQADDFKDFQIIIPKKAGDTSPRNPPSHISYKVSLHKWKDCQLTAMWIIQEEHAVCRDNSWKVAFGTPKRR